MPKRPKLVTQYLERIHRSAFAQHPEIIRSFENRPGIDLSALEGHPVCVALFLGPKSKLKPALVDQISTLPFEVRLIKVGVSKKNLLDFVLTFHLGEMVSRNPRGHYHIVSDDKKDFAPVVDHLKGNHFHVSLHPDIAGLPFLPQPKSVEQATAPAKPVAASKPAMPGTIRPTVDQGSKIIGVLLNHQKRNRPTTAKSLAAYIASRGKDFAPHFVEEVIGKLRLRGMTIDDKGKVTYPSA